jgi:DNA-binding transcriptional LysR family regulator
MDIELLKTFIEVTRTRHFSRAADNLFLTPAAISARIRQLEQILGVSLLHRIRGNIQMTPEGERLLPHALQLVNAWQQAREDVIFKSEQHQRLGMGSTIGLWHFALQGLIARIRNQLPALELRAEAYGQEALVERLLARQLDLALVCEPTRQAELTCVKAGQLKLALISSRPETTLRSALTEHYVYVDWGAAFDQFHAKRLGELQGTLYTNQGSLALDFLRHTEGSAYLPEAVLNGETSLFRVAGAPVFTRSLYACYRANDGDAANLQSVLSILTGDGTQ